MHAAVSPDPDTRRRAARDVSGRTKDDGVMVEMNLVGADVGERSAAVTRHVEFLKADINATGVLRVHADGLIVAALAAIARTVSPCHTRPCAAAIRRLEKSEEWKRRGTRRHSLRSRILH